MTDVHSCSYYCDRPECIKAQRDELRERLAQPEQEPFGYFQLDLRLDAWVQNRNSNKGVAFYTAPPQRKPLTDGEIWSTYKNLWMFHPAEEPRLAGDVLKFARAIEAKLKEKNT